ncbi:MAG: RHS repeat domain-containing protein, partial [Stenotrophomonas bentonitica]
MTVRGTRPNQPPLFKSYSGISAPYIQLPIGGGGGGTAAPAQTSKEQETDDRQDDCPEVSGNPVVLYTGNKVEPELDFASQGEMGLYLQRTYNHHWSAVGIFGQHWLSNFDYSLAFSDERNLAWSQRPDGRRIKFLRDLSSGHWFEDKAQPVAYIKQNGDGSFTLHNEQRGTESYNAEGFITQQRDEQGVAWTYSYNNRYLQRVTHSSGRQINFSWSNGQLVRVTDPAGNAYQYTYTANA